MAALRCRPGDRAIVVRFGLASALLGRPVQLTNEPPFYIGSAAFWNLAEPVVVRYDRACVDARGQEISADRPHRILGIADQALRPIRDPGDDAVDETLIYAGDPRVRELMS